MRTTAAAALARRSTGTIVGSEAGSGGLAISEGTLQSMEDRLDQLRRWRQDTIAQGEDVGHLESHPGFQCSTPSEDFGSFDSSGYYD